MIQVVGEDVQHGWHQGLSFDLLPKEVLTYILSFLDVYNLLLAARVSWPRSAGCSWKEIMLPLLMIWSLRSFGGVAMAHVGFVVNESLPDVGQLEEATIASSPKIR